MKINLAGVLLRYYSCCKSSRKFLYLRLDLKFYIMAKAITDANFAETLNTEMPVVVDFWATWCGPCKAIAPVVDEIAEDYEGKAVVCKCNVDECDNVPMTYGIRSIPTLLFFKNGELVDRHVGVASKAELAAKIDALL